MTILRMLGGEWNIEEMAEIYASPAIAWLFWAVVFVLAQLVMLNIFLAIVMEVR